jgi:membrane associated rhomboid family serine protease
MGFTAVEKILMNHAVEPTKKVIPGDIIIANVAVFLLCQITGGTKSQLYRGLAMRTDLVLEGQVWRLFTFTYLHDQSTILHIFLNMLGLYFLGVPLERYWGARPFFLFYTLGGFVAVLLWRLLRRSPKRWYFESKPFLATAITRSPFIWAISGFDAGSWMVGWENYC